MARDGLLDYAVTRVQAQHGRLPGDADWRVLEASHDLGHYLERARTSALADWISSFDPAQDIHLIERSLRTQWQSHVEQVASWHPPEERAWLSWLACLPALPLLSQLARPGSVPPWLEADPVLGPLAAGGPAERAAALRGTALAPLAGGIDGQLPLGALWRQHWQMLTPPLDPRTATHHLQLQRALDSQADALARGERALSLRQSLRARLAVVFLRARGTGVASACHLGMLALDLERLRGGLASRCVAAPGARPAERTSARTLQGSAT